MIPRIKNIQALPDYILSVVFDDGYHVHYDVKNDFNLPGYDVLRTEYGVPVLHNASTGGAADAP